jgi:endonuclease/exonuclease/phosphatase family metal-dependent hydrolase
MPVDSLNSALRSADAYYTIAATEIASQNRGWHRNGNYILYKPSVYRAYAASAAWDLGYNRSGVYQPLENIVTGARFLFVCTHLSPGQGSTIDQERQAEAAELVKQATHLAAALGVPVIYSGDFNPNATVRHPVDGPGIVMSGAGIDDARMVAQARRNERYDSMNQYSRTPWAYSSYIDYLWAPEGVAVTSWGSALRLSDGQFVGTIPSDHNPVYATLLYPY